MFSCIVLEKFLRNERFPVRAISSLSFSMLPYKFRKVHVIFATFLVTSLCAYEAIV